jgi:anti-anti-sigma factor
LDALAIHIEKRADKPLLIVRLSGSLLSREDSDKLSRLLNDSLEGKNYILLDLNGLRFMNSEGLGALLKLFTRVRRDGGDMAIYGINDVLKQLFLITRLTHIFQVFEKETDALVWLDSVDKNSPLSTSA